MNLKRILLIFFVLSQMTIVFSQSIEFTYDDNGNRLTRTIIVEQLQSQNIKFPVVNPKSLIPADSKAQAQEINKDAIFSEFKDELESEDGEIATVVYPNPNKGLIKIDISNLPLNSTSETRLFDLNGNELSVIKNIESHSEIDINKYRDGIYILQNKD